MTAAVLLGPALAGCGGGDGFVSTDPAAPYSARVRALDTAGFPVVGATVYLVPVGAVDTTPFDGAAVRAGTSEDRDEPLEDAVRLHGNTFSRAQTDTSGNAYLSGVAEGRYFCFVQPAAGDAEHLPGGSECRLPREAVTLSAASLVTVLSSQPGAGSSYLGSTTCVGCHTQLAVQKTHAHRVGLAVPGHPGTLQDLTRYPGVMQGWDRFTPGLTFTVGTVVWLSDYDASRGTDKFKASLTDPTPKGETVYVKAWLWRDISNGLYKITLQNVHPMAGVPVPGAPNPWTLTVPLTYGGAVFRQIPLVAVAGRKGRYPLLQFQVQGDDSRFDRTRRVYRDYGLGEFWDDANKRFRMPAASTTFEGNCMGCHGVGFQRFQDGGTGEWLTDTVNDPAGVFDLDADGQLDEINIGCETCHGPGGQHGNWAADPANAGRQARYIVSPRNLSPSRETQLCGRCHDHPTGHGTVVNDEPLDAMDRMARPGVSRMEFLANHVTRKGPDVGDYWSDQLYSRTHHQQFADFLKSPKYRNTRLLVTCSDCHDSHGTSPWEHHLKGDPADSVKGLCLNCHLVEVLGHMQDKAGFPMLGLSTQCRDCHLPKTAQSGSGVYGGLLFPPMGLPTDPNVTYFTNDIASHLFRGVPSRFHPDVAGEVPGTAMPVPYTNACGASCHDLVPIQSFPKPRPSLFDALGIPEEGGGVR